MKLNIDQTTDFSTRELYRYLDGNDIPGYVKEAELDTPEITNKYGGEAFADKVGKTFPIISPASTYVSNAYFINKRASLSKIWGNEYTEKVAQRIADAGALWNISSDLSSYSDNQLKKLATDYSSKFVFTKEVEDQSIELYPVKTAEDFVKAAEDFNRNVNRYPFSWRADMANNFVKMAKDFGVDELPDLLCKYAGLMYPDADLVNKEIWRRSTKLAEDKQAGYISTLTKAVEAASTVEDFQKIAESMASLEKEAGIHYQGQDYKTLGDPVDKIFTLTLDKVAEMLNLVEMGGHKYQVQELKKISSAVYKEAFGIDIDVSSDAQLHEVLPTMPRSDVALFEELSGVKPIV